MGDPADDLLDGLQGPELESRRALLAMLREHGFDDQELAAASAESRLALLPVQRTLGGRYTAAEVERLSGTPASVMLRIRRLSGLSQPGEHDRVFGDADIAAARSTQLFLDAGLDEEGLAEVSRVLGESMWRIAATITGVFAQAFLTPGDAEDAVALRFAALAEQLAPATAPVLVAAFNAHLREAVGRGIIGQAELETGRVADAQDLTVAFADLVGFTRLGGELELRELGGVAGRLAQLATEVAEAPVRLVKTIGDAALFACAEPEPLIAAALALLDAAAAADLPSLRVGVSRGPTLLRAGDLFGHNVNLASRVTGVARPDSVLCTEEVRDALPDACRWSFAGSFHLKGIEGSVRLHRARARPAAAPGGQPERSTGALGGQPERSTGALGGEPERAPATRRPTADRRRR